MNNSGFDIKHDFLQESCLIVSDYSQIPDIIFNIYNGSKFYLQFEEFFLKNVFISKLKHIGKPIKIINCNSSLSRLLYDLDNIDCDSIIIIDNINNCDDFDIFKRITKLNPSVYIC